MANKKYYWLKLKRDFFKRHDTMIIESMENGKDYLLFYLKLLVESIDHDGELRFSDTIPYNEKMLSTITNTNIDIVRAAVKVFSELNLMEVLEDGTIFMTQVELMIGSETNKAASMRKIRTEQKEEVTMLPHVTESYEPLPNCYTEKEKEKEKEKEIDIEKEGEEENSPPYFLIPVEFHERLNKKLALTTMPTEKENLQAAELLRGVGDLQLILKCLDAFFDDSLDWWFTRKSKVDPKKRAYHFGTFCKLAPAELVPYVREKTKDDQSAAEAKEHRIVKANPPKKCSCGGEIVQGTPEAARCTKCKKIYHYSFQQNSWGEVA